MTFKLLKLRLTGSVLRTLISIREWGWISKLLKYRKGIIDDLVTTVEKEKAKFKDEE